MGALADDDGVVAVPDGPLIARCATFTSGQVASTISRPSARVLGHRPFRCAMRGHHHGRVATPAGCSAVAIPLDRKPANTSSL